MPSATLKNTLISHFADLSPMLQRAAQYVLDHPDDVAMRSLRQIAGNSGLTPPTYSRLARAVGFERYEDLRNHCRASLQRSHLSLSERAALLQSDNDDNAKEHTKPFAVRQLQSALFAVQRLSEEIDLEQLDHAANRLAQARRVLLVGSMSGRAMISYLEHMATMTVPNWHIVEERTSSGPALLAEAGDEDVILAVAISPYAQRTIQIVQMAAEAGASPIVITDNLRSPLLKSAKISFLVPTQSPQFFPSHVAIVTVLETIMGLVVNRLGEKAQSKIQAVERTNHAIGDYWQR